MPGRRGVLRPVRDAAHAAMPMEVESARRGSSTLHGAGRAILVCAMSQGTQGARRASLVFCTCVVPYYTFFTDAPFLAVSLHRNTSPPA